MNKKEPIPDTKTTEVKLTQSQIKKILRTVPLERAFHFYEGIGKPTGEAAKSLVELRDKINAVTLRSLVFHLRRKDFEKWITEVIGDQELAEKIGNISTNSFDLQVKLYATISKRVKKLDKILSTSQTTPEDVPITTHFSTAKIPDIKNVT